MEVEKQFFRVALLLVVMSCLSFELGMIGLAFNITTPTPTSNVTTPTPTPHVTTPTPTPNVTTPIMTPTATQRVTTTPKTPTTPPPLPLLVGNWSVKDAQGSICMWMSFGLNLSITYELTNDNVTTTVFQIDPNTVKLTSDCNSSSTRKLTVGLSYRGWAIYLSFQRQSGKYSMPDVGATWVYDNHLPDAKLKGITSSADERVGNFLMQKVALGNYYTCSSPLSVSISPAKVTLWHMQMQPFADKAGGKLGKAEKCASGLSLGVIVAIAVAGGVVLVGVIVAVVCVVKRRKKTTFSQLENE